MGTLDFEWEVVDDFGPIKGRKSKKKEVWVSRGGKGSWSRLNISADLVDELCWTPGVRVNLLRAKGMRMYALRPSNVGLIELKGTGNSLYYQAWQVVAELNIDQNGVEFDAWVDGESLVFKPKEPRVFAK